MNRYTVARWLQNASETVADGDVLRALGRAVRRAFRRLTRPFRRRVTGPGPTMLELAKAKGDERTRRAIEAILALPFPAMPPNAWRESTPAAPLAMRTGYPELTGSSPSEQATRDLTTVRGIAERLNNQ